MIARNWQEPVKRINDSHSLSLFRGSAAYDNLNEALSKIIRLIQGIDIPVESISSSSNRPPPSSDQKDADSPHIPAQGVINILQRLLQLIDETPPFTGPRRYGNMACRQWHDKMYGEIDQLLAANIGPYYREEDFSGFLSELKNYLLNSFGSRLRLDFGTGHELSFMAVLGALMRFGCLDDITGKDMLLIWQKYYMLVKKLIVTYTLEPAGSHGVWGLDDHFHLIYILGAAQFTFPDGTTNTSGKIVPSVASIMSSQTISIYSNTNFYISAIAFIQNIKKGPFNEHSPLLYDITRTARNWNKVLKGMMKMYEVEVLGKFPVVQHFYFGEVLYPWKDLRGNDLPDPVPSEVDGQQSNQESSSIYTDFQIPSTTTHIPTKIGASSHNATAAPWTRQTPLPHVPTSTRFSGAHPTQFKDLPGMLRKK